MGDAGLGDLQGRTDIIVTEPFIKIVPFPRLAPAKRPGLESFTKHLHVGNATDGIGHVIRLVSQHFECLP